MWKETHVKEWTIQDFKDFYNSGEMDSHEHIIDKLGYLAAYSDLPFESECVEEIEGDTDRWTQQVEVIWLIDGEHYAFCYDKPLTEMQEGSECYYSPFKVKQVKKVVETTEWVAVDE